MNTILKKYLKSFKENSIHMRRFVEKITVYQDEKLGEYMNDKDMDIEEFLASEMNLFIATELYPKDRFMLFIGMNDISEAIADDQVLVFSFPIVFTRFDFRDLVGLSQFMTFLNKNPNHFLQNIYNMSASLNKAFEDNLVPIKIVPERLEQYLMNEGLHFLSNN